MDRKVGGPPHFDGHKFSYWKVRMSAYLEAISSEVWKVTKDGYASDDNPTIAEIKANSRARSKLFEAISEEVFDRVQGLETAHEIWSELVNIHEGSAKIREQKYHVLRHRYDSFKMNSNENCNDMYSRLNVLVKEINGLNINKIKTGDINRKILMLLHKPKYNIIIAMLQKEDLDSMEVSELVGEVGAHEMSILGMVEGESSSKNIAFKAKNQRSHKLKHEEEEDEEEEEESSSCESDEELAQLMKKFARLSHKIHKKGYNFDPKKNMFRRRGSNKTMVCFNCGEKGHISPDCPLPDMRRKSKHHKESSSDEECAKHQRRSKHHQVSSDDEDERHKVKSSRKNKKHEKKKLLDKKKKFVGSNKRSFMVGKNEWVTDISSSDDSSEEEKLAVFATTHDDDKPLPPPPMCLMAKGNIKVSHEEDVRGRKKQP